MQILNQELMSFKVIALAEKIGFKSGDIIKTIFQEDIKSMYQATSLLNTVGRQIPIVVSRDKKDIQLTLPAKQSDEAYGLGLGPEGNSLSSSIIFGFNQTIFWIENTLSFYLKLLMEQWVLKT